MVLFAIGHRVVTIEIADLVFVSSLTLTLDGHLKLCYCYVLRNGITSFDML